MDLPLNSNCAQHFAKVWVRDVAVRVAEVRVVESVKELAAELEPDALADVEVLEDAEVPVGERWPAQRVPAQIAVSEAWGHDKRAGVKPDAAGPGLLVEAIGERVAHQICPLEVAARTHVGVVKRNADLEWPTGLQGGDPRHFPTVE